VDGGQTWTQLSNVPEFAKAPGLGGYEYNTVVDFNGVAASSVRLTALSIYSTTFPYAGLSEVRFMYVPVWARLPYPEPDATDVPVDTTLTWRSGIGADQHNLYISTDEQLNVTPVTISESAYYPALVLGQNYYWRIDEVNNNNEPVVWAGDTWSLSTVDSLVVEDFEAGYDDSDENAVWATWIDGYGTTTNGSQMGNDVTPFLSTTNHNGGHSAPIKYDNTGTASISEVTAQVADLPIGTTDWTIGSPTTLVLWIQGSLENNAATDRLYVKVGNTKVLFTGDISKPRWMQFNVDLSTPGINLSNVSTLTIGVEKIGATGGTGTILIDDIRLYNVAPAIPAEEYWIEAESGTITAPFEVFTDENASGGQYVGKTRNTNSDNNGSPIVDGTAMATYTFTVQGGVYMIDLRWACIAENYSNSDGYWVQIEPAPEAIKTENGDDATLTDSTVGQWLNDNNMRPRSTDWHWSYIHSDDNSGDPDVQFTLPAGTYTLKFANRDAGTMLDALVITKVAD